MPIERLRCRGASNFPFNIPSEAPRVVPALISTENTADPADQDIVPADALMRFDESEIRCSSRVAERVGLGSGGRIPCELVGFLLARHPDFLGQSVEIVQALDTRIQSLTCIPSHLKGLAGPVRSAYGQLNPVSVAKVHQSGKIAVQYVGGLLLPARPPFGGIPGAALAETFSPSIDASKRPPWPLSKRRIFCRRARRGLRNWKTRWSRRSCFECTGFPFGDIMPAHDSKTVPAPLEDPVPHGIKSAEIAA